MLFFYRLDQSFVQQMVEDARQRFPELEPVVLTNLPLTVQGARVVDVNLGDPSVLDPLLGGGFCFVYASDQDDVALPYLERVVDAGQKFLPALKADPAPWTNFDVHARRAIEDEHLKQTTEHFDKFDYGPWDFVNLMQAISITRDLPGHYVEIGCFGGSSSGVALRYHEYAGVKRRCWFFDVFDGFTYDEAKESPDAFWADSHMTQGHAVISERLKAYARPEQGLEVEVIKANIITDELPDAIDQICVANLDVDMYEAVYAGLLKLHPRMVSGGLLILEDAGHTPWLIGARLALEQFLAREGKGAYTSIYMQSGQTFLVRR